MQTLDLVGVLVDANHTLTGRSEAGAGDEADVTCTNDAEFHGGAIARFHLPERCDFRVFGLTSAHGGAHLILTNIDSVPGRRIVQHFGLVQGSTIRAKHFGRDFAAGLKNIVGGELKGYTELLQESRAEATSRMVAQASELGANAVINVRFTTSSVAQGAVGNSGVRHRRPHRVVKWSQPSSGYPSQSPWS